MHNGHTTVRISRDVHTKLWHARLKMGKPISSIVEEAVREYLRKAGILVLMLILLPLVHASPVIVESPQPGQIFTEDNVTISFYTTDPDFYFYHVRLTTGDTVVFDLLIYEANVTLHPDLVPGEYQIIVREFRTDGRVTDIVSRNFTVVQASTGTTGRSILPPGWDAFVVLIWFAISIGIAVIPQRISAFPEKAVFYVFLTIVAFMLDFHNVIGIAVGFPFAMMLLEASQYIRKR